MPTRSLSELKSYIQMCLSKNFEPGAIKDRLNSAGWSTSMIEDAFSELDIVSTRPFLAKDIMNTEYVRADSDSELSEVLNLMKIAQSRHAIILEKGIPVGFLTGSDIISVLSDDGSLDLSTKCSEIMTPTDVSCRHDEKIRDVCWNLKTEHVPLIPVMQKKKLIGVISASELIDFMSL